MGRKILLTCASVFLIFQSYKLVFSVEYFEIESWFINFLLAWVINMFVTGIFACAVFAWPMENLFPEFYYKVHQPKRLKKIYKVLKVELFRKFLLATVWRSRAQQQKYFNGKSDGIDNLETQSKKSDFGHILPFIILLLISVYIILKGKIILGVMVCLFNIIGNLYPVILQRHHRMRIQILRKRYART